MRHGMCLYRGRQTGVTAIDEATSVSDGGRQFLLSTVDAAGESLHPLQMLYMPSVLRKGFVVSSQLLSKMREQCRFDDSIIVQIPRGDLLAHRWPDVSANDDELYERLRQDLHLYEGFPPDDEILQSLCLRYPECNLPDMYVVLPPWVRPMSNMKKHREQDHVMIDVAQGTTVVTPNETVPWRHQPANAHMVLRYEGFLFPDSAGECLEPSPADRHLMMWKIAVSIKDQVA